MGGSRAIRGVAAGGAAFLLLVACGSSPATSGTTPDPGINKVGATVFPPSGRTTLSTISGKTLSGSTLALTSLRGHVVVLNVWASWCVPCRQEGPVLAAIAGDFGTGGRVRLVGINYKDQPGNARAFLGEVGNPFTAIGVDQMGRAAIDWGVYGVPETFIVGPDGIIIHKFIGPLTAEIVADDLKPLIAKVLASPGATMPAPPKS